MCRVLHCLVDGFGLLLGNRFYQVSAGLNTDCLTCRVADWQRLWRLLTADIHIVLSLFSSFSMAVPCGGKFIFFLFLICCSIYHLLQICNILIFAILCTSQNYSSRKFQPFQMIFACDGHVLQNVMLVQKPTQAIRLIASDLRYRPAFCCEISVSQSGDGWRFTVCCVRYVQLWWCWYCLTVGSDTVCKLLIWCSVRWGKFSQNHNSEYLVNWWCLLAIEKLHVSAYSGHNQVLQLCCYKSYV